MAVVHAELAHDDNAQRITVRLHESLAKLVGTGGFDVLLARSLVLARRTHPFLAGVVAGPGGTLTGFGEAASDRVSVEAATVAIVSYFIELLVVLVGEDLAMRLLRDVWREASDSGSAPPEDEKK
jgi:hypothetical protein